MAQSTASSSKYHRSEDASVYRENASFVFNDENTAAVMQLLDPRPGDVILDVGCGSGELTHKLHAIVTAQGASGRVIGLDVSADMIKAANADLAGGEGEQHTLRFDVCDGHEVDRWLDEQRLTGTFDKVFSNAALHWIKRDPAAVIRGMRAALKKDDPASRLAIEFGGFLNCVAVRSSLHTALRKRQLDPTSVDPWYFPTAKAYAALLTEHGFTVDTSYLFPRPTPLPVATGIRGWLKSFAGPFLNALPDETEREKVVNEVLEQLKVDMYDTDEDQWTIMCEFSAAYDQIRCTELTDASPDVRLRVRATITSNVNK